MTIEQGDISPLDSKEVVLVNRRLGLKELDQFNNVVPVHGVAGFAGGRCCEQCTNTLIRIDWLLVIAHSVQAIDGSMRPAMGKEFFNRK